jgi:hypothetical protein
MPELSSTGRREDGETPQPGLACFPFFPFFEMPAVGPRGRALFLLLNRVGIKNSRLSAKELKI